MLDEKILPWNRESEKNLRNTRPDLLLNIGLRGPVVHSVDLWLELILNP